MVVEKAFLLKLRDFGLNTYESRLWAALLSRGTSTAGELSDIANVPRSRSYDVLESLERKGFIITKPGKPIKYVAVSPVDVLERIKNKIEKQAKENERLVEELKKGKLLSELNLLHSQGQDQIEPNELVGSIKGRSNIMDQLGLMFKSAKKHLSLVIGNEEVAGKTKFAKLLNTASKKGVKTRVIASLTKTDPGFLGELTKQGTDVRVVKDVDARMCIVDGKETFFMLLSDSDVHPNYDVGVWVNSPYFSSALKKMFDSTWSSAQ